MTGSLRIAVGTVGCLMMGGLAWFVLGAGPQTGDASGREDAAWSLPVEPSPDLAAADAIWDLRLPWGARPVQPGGVEEVIPMSIPVGTTRAGGELLAVFLAPDGSTSRVRAGEDLAGGGRVEAVTEFNVSWIDPRGAKHEQRLLADPLPSQATP